MTNPAQVDKIISEVGVLDKKGKILVFHKLKEILDNDTEDIDIESVFGLWKGRGITTEYLRERAWKQNQSIC